MAVRRLLRLAPSLRSNQGRPAWQDSMNRPQLRILCSQGVSVIIISWFTSPLLAGIGGAILFLFTRHAGEGPPPLHVLTFNPQLDHSCAMMWL